MKKTISWVLLISIVLSGCMTTRPERFATIEEAYPEGQITAGPNASTDSYNKSMFNAPYEEVFRAATVAIAQIKDYQGNTIISIESSDPAKGTILATSQIADTRRFYAVSVKKAGLNRTEVAVGSKMQTRSDRCFTPVGVVFFTVFSLGIALPIIIWGQKECEETTTVHWEQDANISHILAGTRNNLIQAGNL